MNKNWSNDLNIGCKSLFNLMELIKNDLSLGKEFEEFEGLFEYNELMDI
jgi:hypothetical protein